MFRRASRIVSAAPGSQAIPKRHSAKRFVSTAPPHPRPRSWKSSVARWGLAGGLVYCYNTATVFAEEPAYAVNALSETSRENETLPTVATLSEQRRAQARSDQVPSQRLGQNQNVAAVPDGEATAAGSPEALEDEASEQGAFNEETGEINWDCPCLGGMAHGPCGEQFKAAFSCFVFSKEEPKGVDCIEHFKTMQNCFREHPDVYGAELDDDDAPPLEDADSVPAAVTAESQAVSSVAGTDTTPSKNETGLATKPPKSDPADVIAREQEYARARGEQVKVDRSMAAETDDASPKAWHDATDANKGN